MGSAYVPGLKVLEHTTMHLERRLPLQGTVCVELGQNVRYDQVVARTELPGHVEMINAAAYLGIEPNEVPAHMVCQVGQSVSKGQAIAINNGFFGLFKTALEAPLAGTIESLSEVSGQVVLRAPAQPVEIKAYVNGKVEEILGQDGVIISAHGTLIQGIFGIGGETAGPLAVLASNPQAILTPDDLSEEQRGAIVVGGSLLTLEVIRHALEVGVHALVGGGINDSDLREFMGYDLGIAITGSENLGLTLIITEGFGPIDMAKRTFELLKAHQGQLACVSGATQIRAGVIRPEIIIPSSEDRPDTAPPPELNLIPGAKVRLIRDPHFGELAQVLALPTELTLIPTGAKVRVAEIELADGQRLMIPRTNLELIAQ